MDPHESDEVASLMHWVSLGHGEEYAISTSVLQDSLVTGIAELKRMNTSSTIIDITGGALLPEGLALHHDDPLLPLWKSFAEALFQTKANDVRPIDLHFTHTYLTKEVMSILEPVLKAAPLDYLMFTDNRLGQEGIKFVVRILTSNPLVRYLVLSQNKIQDRDDLLSLVYATKEHPTLEYFNLEGCGVGSNLTLMPNIVPDLLNLHNVNLARNSIGSRAASIISACLATNPVIKILVLDSNLFGDDDANKFASSLKSNKNLRQFDLCGNNFTHAGIRSLLKSTFDDRSLNAINDSNHTCRLKLFADGNIAPSCFYEKILSMNAKTFEMNVFSEEFMMRCVKAARDDLNILAEMMLIQGRKGVKFLHALWSGNNTGRCNMQYLNCVALELMPEVLAIFQDYGKRSGTERQNLDTLFELVCSSPGVMSFHGAHSRKLTKHSSFTKHRPWKQLRKKLRVLLP